MSPGLLDSILARLPRQTDPNVLVGFETADDAGVYLLPRAAAAERERPVALVQTVDFFTPVVDDPFTFGQIAAANALSDVYAMGGCPITALAVAGFPGSGHKIEILEAIIAGGFSKMQEAGCSVIGGHSIGDEEIKFGYAVTGLVDPRRILKNSTAQPGDRLVLTKSIGTGVIATALKAGRAHEESIVAAVESMCTLNRSAGEAALAHNVHAATDVTGFGLLGHAREMAVGSSVSLTIESSKVPFLPGAVQCATEGFLPGGLKRNVEFAGACVAFADEVSEPVRSLLFDPQTSGGLLLSVAPEDAGGLIRDLSSRGAPSHEIGWVAERTKPLISVR